MKLIIKANTASSTEATIKRMKASIASSTDALVKAAIKQMMSAEDSNNWLGEYYERTKAQYTDWKQLFDEDWDETYGELYGPSGEFSTLLNIVSDGSWGEMICHIMQTYASWKAEPEANKLAQALVQVDWDAIDS